MTHLSADYLSSPYAITLDNIPTIESIEVKNISAFLYVKKMFDPYRNTPLLYSKGNVSLISDYSVGKLMRMVLLTEGIVDEEKFHALAPKVRGNGVIKFTFVHEQRKIIAFTIISGSFDECFYSFIIGDKVANVPLKHGMDVIRKFIKEFISM